MTSFDHERLDVYRVAIEFVAWADPIALPTGHAHKTDQLNRASTSVVLNIAEGAGEYSKKEKVRFYRMAKRSATECAAVLDVLHVLRLAPEASLSEGRTLLLRIVSMLIKMIQSIEGTSGRGEE